MTIPLLRPVPSLRLGREVRQVPVKWTKDDESFKKGGRGGRASAILQHCHWGDNLEHLCYHFNYAIFQFKMACSKIIFIVIFIMFDY